MARESLPLADPYVLVGIRRQHHRAGAFSASDADLGWLRDSRARIFDHRYLGFLSCSTWLARASSRADGAMIRRRLFALVCLITSTGLVGCGQTGPLYLPDEDAKVVIKPAANE